ncbi:hypothetical protein quinque_007632 [Culex quinquefasciatus]
MGIAGFSVFLQYISQPRRWTPFGSICGKKCSMLQVFSLLSSLEQPKFPQKPTMKVTFFLLLVAAVAFLAVFQPAVDAAPQDVATADERGTLAEGGSDGKPEGGAAAGGSSSEEQGGKKGHGKGKGQHGGKGGKGGEKGGEKGGKGKGQANKEKGAKGQANKGKGQGKGKN